MKKKIAWITPSCFVDVDLPIIKELQIVYDIHWYVVLQPKDGENTKAYIEETLGKDKIVFITYEWQVYRMRSFKNALFIYRLIRKVKEGSPTVYYTSEYALPFGIWLYKWLLPIRKIVVACHNVTTPRALKKMPIFGKTNENVVSFYTCEQFSDIQIPSLF